MPNKHFKPPWWLYNKHVQSCAGLLFGKAFSHKIRWQEFNLADGDFIDLAWIGNPQHPVTLMLTGFEGGMHSHYVRMLASSLVAAGHQVCVVHYRGCSGRLNRLSRTYHVGDYHDFAAVCSRLTEAGYKVRYAVGFSMGANVLVKYLMNYQSTPLLSSVLVSPIFNVNAAAEFCARFYQYRLVYSIRQKLRKKMQLGYPFDLTPNDLRGVYRMRDLDRLITAPMFGYDNATEYYIAASIGEDLPLISHPLLLLHAEDDPFVPSSTTPARDELHLNSRLSLSKRGGHIGFMAGASPWSMNFWAAESCLNFFSDLK